MLFTPGCEPSHITLIVQHRHVDTFFMTIVIFNGSVSRFDIEINNEVNGFALELLRGVSQTDDSCLINFECTAVNFAILLTRSDTYALEMCLKVERYFTKLLFGMGVW